MKNPPGPPPPMMPMMTVRTSLSTRVTCNKLETLSGGGEQFAHGGPVDRSAHVVARSCEGSPIVLSRFRGVQQPDGSRFGVQVRSKDL